MKIMDPSKFLQSHRLHLRKLVSADVGQRYCEWMNSPDVVKYTESRFLPTSEEDLRLYVNKMNDDSDTVLFAIILTEGNRHIGNIKLGPINRVHCHAEVGLIVGEQDCWGLGFGTEAINLIVEYAFKRINLRWLTAGCYGSNIGSIKAFQRNGFVIKAKLENYFFCAGEYEDYVLLGLPRLNTGQEPSMSPEAIGEQ